MSFKQRLSNFKANPINRVRNKKLNIKNSVRNFKKEFREVKSRPISKKILFVGFFDYFCINNAYFIVS